MPAEPAAPASARRRYHPHWPGALFVGVTVLIGIGAINGQYNLLLGVFGLALGAMVFSGLLSGAMLMGVSVERAATGPATAGEPLRVSYTLRNANRLAPAFALSVAERDAPGSLSGLRAFAGHVGPGEAVRTRGVVTPSARGEARLTEIQVSTTFPFGVFRKSVRASAPAKIVVRPARLPLPPGALDAVASSGDTEDAIDRRRGRGAEFYGLRDYAPGDSPRLIAWRATARLNTVVVRQNQEPRGRSVVCDLALSGAPDDASREADERAISMAATAVDECVARGWRVGLRVAGAGIDIEPGAGRRHESELLDALAVIDLGALAGPGDAGPERPAGARLPLRSEALA